MALLRFNKNMPDKQDEIKNPELSDEDRIKIGHEQYLIKSNYKKKQDEMRFNAIKYGVFIPLILIFITFICTIGLMTATGNGMSPVINNGDILVIDKISYLTKSPDIGDVVIYNNNEVGRIVGTPGTTVKTKDGYVVVNNVELNETYLNPGETTTMTGITLSNGQYLILKDNRQNNPSKQVISGTKIKSKVISVIPLSQEIQKEHVVTINQNTAECKVTSGNTAVKYQITITSRVEGVKANNALRDYFGDSYIMLPSDTDAYGIIRYTYKVPDSKKEYPQIPVTVGTVSKGDIIMDKYCHLYTVNDKTTGNDGTHEVTAYYKCPNSVGEEIFKFGNMNGTCIIKCSNTQ